MFTVEQIKAAHSKVKSGADFPKYIQEIKQLGVMDYITWVTDGHTEYFGENGFKATSQPNYASLEIAAQRDKPQFVQYLKNHQQGGSDYPTFSRQAAETGIEKWVVSLEAMICVYYDRAGGEVLAEAIPR
jgi:uncharacterized protein YbcV (DUF1398 family)